MENCIHDGKAVVARWMSRVQVRRPTGTEFLHFERAKGKMAAIHMGEKIIDVRGHRILVPGGALIPLSRPYVDRDDGDLVGDVLQSGWLTQGPKVEAFEKAVAQYVDMPFAVATTSCTTALHLALLALDIGPGCDVITVSYTFVATVNAILYTGATPRLVEIDPDTLNMDASLLEEFIQTHYEPRDQFWAGKKTGNRLACLLPVHQFGLPADMDALYALATRYRCSMVEDAACSLGSMYKNRPAGHGPYLSTLSFHPRKVITTGEGGMVLTGSEKSAARMRSLRAQGASVSDVVRHHSVGQIVETFPELGYNYRMSDIQAAVGVRQMAKLERGVGLRTHIASKYASALEALEGLRLPIVPDYVTRFNYQSYCIRVMENGGFDRDKVVEKVRSRGVTARRGISPVHREPYFVRRFGESRLPITEKTARHDLLIPLYPQMTEGEIDAVISAVKGAIS